MSIEVYVGTSGWTYDWNPEKSFDWYVKYSGLNAVELNASFYRFPFPNIVKSWARKSSDTRWAIKVHQSITHFKKLSTSALEIWTKFHRLFEPLESKIDFYLFQLPPSYVKNRENVEKLMNFAKATELKERFAVEFRHESWFNEDTVNLCQKLEITVVSIDAPIATWIVKSSDIVYLRMHGKTTWYSYEYSEDEIREICMKVLQLKPKKIYVFFNNDHWMLGNARYTLKLLNELKVNYA